MRPLVLGACLGSICACAGDSGYERSSLDIGDDVVLVTVVLSDPENAYSPLGWEVPTGEFVEIGDSEGTRDINFSDIRGVQVLRDGRIAVVDGASREVRFFDGGGNFLSRQGGQGDGPGEFQRVDLVPGFGDSVMVQDPDHQRFTVFAEDSASTFASETVGFDVGVGTSGNRILVRQQTIPIRGPKGRVSEPFAVRWLDRQTGEEDTVAVVEDRPAWVSTNSAGETVRSEVPFTVAPSIAVSGEDGTVYLLDNAGLEIAAYIGQDEKRLLRIDDTASEITREMKSRYIDARLAYLAGEYPGIARERRQAIESIPSPSVAPRFQSLLVDELGWVWAEVYRPFEETQAERWMRFGLWSQLRYEPPESTTPVWVIFDPDGQARGTVETPIGLEIRHIAANSIAGVWRDDHGVEYVRKYALLRR